MRAHNLLLRTYRSPVGVHCRIKTFLDHLDVGDYMVSGELEAYSCVTFYEPLVVPVEPNDMSFSAELRAVRQANLLDWTRSCPRTWTLRWEAHLSYPGPQLVH